MCSSCGSSNQADFSSELVIHFTGRENLDRPGIFVFPKLLICLDCGLSSFTVPHAELQEARVPNVSADWGQTVVPE
jgi:hypothetical protein